MMAWLMEGGADDTEKTWGGAKFRGTRLACPVASAIMGAVLRRFVRRPKPWNYPGEKPLAYPHVL